MKALRSCFFASLLAIGSFGAQAAVIPLSSFDGSETVIDFNSESAGSFTGPFVTYGVSFQAASGAYMFQPGGGSLLGTGGAAFNTNGLFPNPNNDLTLLFGSAISRFGMNFGTGSGVSLLSAVVSAYDGSGSLVESASFTNFENAFLGFDFSAPVSKIVIDRTDGSGYFTFIDNVRFVKSTPVPESSSLALLLAGLVGLFGIRKRKNA